MSAHERSNLDAHYRYLAVWRSLQVLDLIQSTLKAVQLKHQLLILAAGRASEGLDEVFDELTGGDEVADCETERHEGQVSI
jgi:hypothetical protein